MKTLQMEFSRKEKTERLLANLEDLKSSESIEASQYDALKQKYTTVIRDATAAIEKRKTELKQKLRNVESDLPILEQELKDLSAKFKVGEFDVDTYKKKERSLSARVSKLENERRNFSSWIDAKSSADVGGFKDIDIEQKPKGKPIDIDKIAEMGSKVTLGDPGTPQEHIQNAIDVIVNPAEFFSKISTSQGILQPLIFAAIVFLINVLGFFIFRMHGHFFGHIFLFYILMIIGIIIYAIILMIVSKILEGSADIESSIQIVAYGSIPSALMFIPFIGPILSLYSIYIMIVGIEKLHNLDRGKAIAVGVITYLLSGVYIWIVMRQIIWSAIVHSIIIF